MAHSRRGKKSVKEVSAHKSKKVFRVRWEDVADALILAIEAGDFSYRDFKKIQAKIDRKYGHRPLEIKEEYNV